ncbi:cutinase family protein [Rhodococcus hoagii]|nr:cutinase family protein [Prescottella equi]
MHPTAHGRDPGHRPSAPDASPTIDGGFLGMSVMIPLLNAAPGDVSRQLVPYAADFGLRGSTYEQSMTEGVEKASEVISSYVSRCPSSMIAIAAFSQGAQIADTHRPEHRCRQGANLR